MTCHRRSVRLLQATCLGLVVTLAGVGCGGGGGAPPLPNDASMGGSMSVPDGATSDGPGFVSDVAVFGLEVAQGPVLTVYPAALNFSEVEVGQISPTLAVTITNTGALVALSPKVDVTVFGVAGTTCTTPAASCTISVVFAPTSVAVSSGTLTVAPGLTVSLSGIGSPPRSFSAISSALPATVLPNQAVPFSVTVLATAALSGLTCVSSSPDLTADPTPANTTCTGAMVANAPCVYGFIFKAATPGAKNDTIVCSAGTTVRNVSVTTTVVTPAMLTIAPSPAPFTSTVGGTSQPVVFSVGNAGGSASGILSAVLGGTSVSEFVITGNKCVVPLDPRANCEIQVVFKPTTPGADKAATLTVTDATAGSTPVVASLTGIAITEAGIVISGPPNLGSVQVGQSGTAAAFTITNKGGTATGALTVAAGDAEFAIGSDGCTGSALAAGATCTFSVTFTPTSPAAKATVLTAASGATVLGTYQISGTGTAPPGLPAIGMLPPRLDFGSIGVGTVSAAQSFTITNTGGSATGTLTVANVAVGGGASQFSYTTTCLAALAPAATCQVVVTYKPTVVGNASATFTVSDGTYSSPDRTVAGTALTSPGISITCPSYDFEDTVVGLISTAKVCTVSNASGGTLASGALTLTATGDFATTPGTAATDCAGKSLAGGDQCTVSIVFKPTAKGDLVGSITVTAANGGTDKKNLTGTGLSIIEIKQFTANGYNLTPVSATNPAFPSSVSAGATSDTTVILAVFVRATGVGNLTVAATDFTTATTPADFTQGTGSVDAIWAAGAAHKAVAACVVGTTSAPPAAATDAPYCTMRVSFTPQSKTPALKTGTVTASGATAGTDTATIQGTSAGPISITPSQLTFAKVAVGTVGAAMTLTICNTGTVAATRASFAITGPNAADFAVTLDEVSYATIAANGTPCVHLALRLDLPAGTDVGTLSATVTVSARIGTGAAAPTETDMATLVGTSVGGAILTVPASPVAFPDTAVTATSAPVTLTVGNTGAVATDPLSFTILDGSEFTLAPPTGQSQGTCLTGTTSGTCAPSAICTGRALAASSDSCTLKVWFQPKGTLGLTSRSDTLAVGSDNAGTKFLTLNGNATSQLTATPAIAIVNGDAPIATVTVANHGASIPAGLSVTFEDLGLQAGQGDFQTVSNNCLNPIASGTPAPTCTVGVELTPTAIAKLGTSSTTVRAVNGSNGQMATVVVTGTGWTGADLEFTPATKIARDFGTVRRGDTSAPIKYTITNVGGVTSGKMTFGVYNSPVATPAVASSDFAVLATGTPCVSSTTTGTVLAPGASCDLMLAFSPGATTVNTELSETLVVRADPGAATAAGLQSPVINAATTTTNAVVYMVTSTTATPPNAAPYDFGIHNTSVNAQTIQLAIHNAGATAVRAGAPSFKNVDGAAANAEFALVTGTGMGTCDFAGTGMALDPNQVCTFTVGWTPGTAVGPRAVVAASVTDTAATASMVLFGRVPGPAVLTATPGSLDFGEVPQDANSPTLTVVVTNTSEWSVHGDLQVTKTGASAADRVQLILVSSTCDGAPLLAGASCNLVARVNPTNPGANPNVGFTVQSATLATETVSVDVNWTGMNPPLINRSSGALSFGNNAVLTTSTAQTVTLTNPPSAGNSRLPTGPLTFTVGGTDGADFAVHAGSTSADCGNVAYSSNGLDPATGTGNGGVCSVTVTFTPRTLGAKSGTLTVTSTSGAQTSIALTGTATAGLTLLSAAPATAAEDRLRTTGAGAGCPLTGGNYACGATDVSAATTFDSETFTFQNAAGSPPTGLLMAGLAGTGTNAAQDLAQFDIVTDTCTGQSVDSGASCKVTVRFQPVATGSWAVRLTVSGTPGDSVSVNLTGTGN